MGTEERRCPNCQRLEAEVGQLRKQLEIALARIAELEREIASLKKNSSTCSKPPALNIAKRFRDHGDEYFIFLDRPGIEPTNNGPERQIRFLAIDRKITQGTRGEAGRRWCERIWTVLAICAPQGRSAFEFIYSSIVAYFTDQPFPSLLPLPP